MQLYVNPQLVSLGDLHGMAERLGMQLYDLRDGGERVRGRNAGRHEYRFTLRPPHGGDREAKYRAVRDAPYGQSGERRIWAICWHGHRDFMRAVFALDTDATFKTSVDTWDGSDDFENRHEDSAYRNIGSQIAPQQYGHACRC
jgi:hypothetical protein